MSLRHSLTPLTNPQGYVGMQPAPSCCMRRVSSLLFIWDAYILCPNYRRAGLFILGQGTVIIHFYR